jgi:hypothetical protein
MSSVLDEGLALFAGLNVIPKRSFLTAYSCRIDLACYPKLLRSWFDTLTRSGTHLFSLAWPPRSEETGTWKDHKGGRS